MINNASSTSRELAVYRQGSASIISTTSIPVNTWTHVAFVRNSTNLRFYINGVQSGTGTDGNSYSSSANIWIGRNNVYTPRDLIGYIDSLRITLGVARYTTNFNPETDTYLQIKEYLILYK